MDFQGSLDPPIPPESLHPVFDQPRGSRIETPNFGVPELHFLLVVGVGLPDSREDPILDLLGDLVSHDGLELWLLQADVREEGTLVSCVKLPYYCVLGTQGKRYLCLMG